MHEVTRCANRGLSLIRLGLLIYPRNKWDGLLQVGWHISGTLKFRLVQSVVVERLSQGIAPERFIDYSGLLSDRSEYLLNIPHRYESGDQPGMVNAQALPRAQGAHPCTLPAAVLSGVSSK